MNPLALLGHIIGEIVLFKEDKLQENYIIYPPSPL